MHIFWNALSLRIKQWFLAQTPTGSLFFYLTLTDKSLHRSRQTESLMGLLFYFLSNSPPPVLDLAPKTALKPFRMADPQDPRSPKNPLPQTVHKLLLLLVKELWEVKLVAWFSISRDPLAFNAASLSVSVAERSRF